MKLASRRPIVSAFLFAWLALCLASCSTPVAPAYRIAKESREVEFIPGPQPELRLRSSYTLLNYGNSEIAFIDVTLPAAQTYGRTNLRVELDGREAPLQPLPPGAPAAATETMRLPFDSHWERKQSHELVIEYSFRSPGGQGERITLGDAEFHLGPRGAFPVLEPPKSLLAPVPGRPGRVPFTVRVPSDFRVLAEGKAHGRKPSGQETEYRFELRSKDLAAYVVGGRYVESSAGAERTPILWTFQPGAIEPAAARAIGGAWGALQKEYGPLDRNVPVPHVVESATLRDQFSREPIPSATVFPAGVLVNSAAIAQGAQRREFVEIVAHALAHAWFGEKVYPSSEAAVGLGEGLPDYAIFAIDTERGGEAARRATIARFLSEYDARLRDGPEKPLAASRLDDPLAERNIALAKAPLFFIALEDECGAKAMRAGIADMVTLLRGQKMDYNTLRSALEHASGKDLAPLFRQWLSEKGIPADFRARYVS